MEKENETMEEKATEQFRVRMMRGLVPVLL